MVIEICKRKQIFVIKVSLPWEWHGTFDEILHYKSFPFPPFSTTNQTSQRYNDAYKTQKNK